jgi:alpha-glucosidase
MFGDALLVSPVESDKLKTDVYLPKGDWYRLSTNEKLKGGKIVNVASPLTDLPVFVKAGAIIPMQSVRQSTAAKGDGILLLHIWNGKKTSEFLYYEDDGLSYNYEQGAYYKRTIRLDPKKKSVTLSAVEGTFFSRFDKLSIVWHGFERGVNDKVVDFVKEEMMIGFV